MEVVLPTVQRKKHRAGPVTLSLGLRAAADIQVGIDVCPSRCKDTAETQHSSAHPNNKNK